MPTAHIRCLVEIVCESRARTKAEMQINEAEYDTEDCEVLADFRPNRI